MVSLLSLYLRKLVLKRERTTLDKMVLLLGRTSFPDHIRRLWDPLGEALARRRIAVFAYSDIDYNLYRRLGWGDYWLKHELTKAIGQLGYLVTDATYEPDVVIHLFGCAMELPKNAYKIIWLHSNPDKVTADLLADYDRVCCISSQFTLKIQAMGFPCEYLPLATAKCPPNNTTKKYQAIFVGNARAEEGERRKIVDDVGHPDYCFKVWGRGYKTLPARYWAGEYVDYTALDELYASSCISLNDHRPAMKKEGFLNPRVLDILASGGFCISDPNEAITDLFGKVVPQYTSPQHLRELIDYFLSRPEERETLAKRGQAIAAQYTWDKVARALLRGIPPKYEEPATDPD